MDLLMNDNTFSTFPPYASDLGCDMGLFSGQFLSTNPSHLSEPTSLPTLEPPVRGPCSLQSPPPCNKPSPTNDVLSTGLNDISHINYVGENDHTEATPPLTPSNTFDDLSGGRIALEAGPLFANIDRTLSLPIQCPPKTTPLLSLASGFGDLFGGQISSTAGPATANAEAPLPAQFPSKTTPSKPTNRFDDPFGHNFHSEFGSQTVNHGASSASLPTHFPPMGHVSPPIITAGHSPVSLSRGSPSPTSLPGTTTAQIDIMQQCSPGASHASLTSLTASASSNLSPTTQPSPSQSVTEALALPADKRRSARPLVPSKRLEAMHEIGSNVPKGLPPTEQPPEKENFDPQAPPEWTRLAREHLVTRDLGPEWQECVNSWLELEARLGYGTMTGTKVCRSDSFLDHCSNNCIQNALPAVDLRPEEWNKWVNKSWNGQRKYEAAPTISDSAEFGIALTKWWHGMQPDFRKSEHDMPLSTYTASTPIMWDPLRKAGPNGMVSVLTMAVWWGQSLVARTRWQDDSTGEWKAFIIDVQRTLSEIAKTTIERKKRGAPGGIPKKSKCTKV